MSRELLESDVWSWASRFSDHVHALDELARLRREVHIAKNTCGSCAAWMTDACPREMHDNTTGRKHGPSGMAIKCDRFVMGAFTAASVTAAEERIATVRAAAAMGAKP